MSQRAPTPEEVVLAMSAGELQELLAALSMESTVTAAMRLRRLVLDLGSFESAIETMAGHDTFKDAA